MRLVIIESPFAAPPGTPAEEAPAIVARNLRYLRACMADCLKRGEAPYASHALYTQPGVLDDGSPAERDAGIEAGFAWRKHADATVVYTDVGISMGMRFGVDAADKLARMQPHPVEFRVLGDGWEQRAIEREASFATRWP